MSYPVFRTLQNLQSILRCVWVDIKLSFVSKTVTSYQYNHQCHLQSFQTLIVSSSAIRRIWFYHLQTAVTDWKVCVSVFSTDSELNISMELSPPCEANSVSGIQEIPSVLWAPKVHCRDQKSPCVVGSSDPASMLQSVIHTSECNMSPQDKTTVGQDLNCTFCVFRPIPFLSLREIRHWKTHIYTPILLAGAVCRNVRQLTWAYLSLGKILDTIKILLPVVCFNLSVWTTESRCCLCQVLRSDCDADRCRILRTPLSWTAIISRSHKSHRNTSMCKGDLFFNRRQSW
jgi:hypothetical protein